MNPQIIFLLIAFLNAFVDIGHKITIQNYVFMEYSGGEQIILTAIINSLILLPFILLFSPAGFLSDKYPKNKIIKYGALAAVGITSLIFISYLMNMFVVAFGLTFLLAIQSAIYGPAKMGYIKDLVKVNEISKLNAWLQSVSIIGILTAIGIFTWIYKSIYVSGEGLTSLIAIAAALIIFSIIEFILATKLPTKSEEREDIKFSIKDWVTLKSVKNTILEMEKKKTVFQSIVGLGIFWVLLQTTAVSFPAHAKEIGIIDILEINMLQTLTGIGIFVGSMVYSKLSKNYIEIGTVPIGAIGVAGSLFIIASSSSLLVLSIAFLSAGIFGGLFIVPLNSFIQANTSSDKLGTVLAGSNFIGSILMLIGLVITTIVAYYGINAQIISYGIAFLAIGSAVYTVLKIPQTMVQLLLKFPLNQKYKVQVEGINNIPTEGGVLLLGNHVSWVDWAIVQIGSPRQIRFLMDKTIFNKWYLKPIMKFFNAIPTSGTSKESLKKIAEALDNGELVCIFPEGVITRNGQLSEFKRGFEKIIELTENKISVIPFYIRGLWGDKMSKAASRTKMNHGKKGSTVTIIFGETIKRDITAENVKQKVFGLSAAAWRAYSKTLEPLHIEVLKNCKNVGSEMIFADSTGTELSGHKFLTASILFKNKLKLEGENIGIILPATAAGAIINMAVLMEGKTLVNLNYTASKDSLEKSIEAAGIKTIITSSQFITKLKAKGFDISFVLEDKKVYIVEELKKDISKVEGLKTLLMVKFAPVTFLENIYFKRVSTEKTAVILFSSGSEGTPKGVELSHENITGNIKQIINIIDPRVDDVILGILPMFHAFGITVTTLLPLMEGVPVVAHPDPTDSLKIGQLITKYNISIMTATSTFLRLYASNRKVHPAMFASLRVIIAGAEKLDINVKKKFKEKFGKDILEGYGTTETSPVATVNIPDIVSPVDFKTQVGNIFGTVGLPIPGTAVKIVDPHDLSEYRDIEKMISIQKSTTGISNRNSCPELPICEEGMILISGPQLMKGYLNDPKKTREVLVEIDNVTWYVTGDKGHVDKNGFVTIVDRYSRFAKLAGEMISLTAVEQELGAIFEDLECIVVAIPDAKKGEKLIVLFSNDFDHGEMKTLVNKSFSNKLMAPSEYIHMEELPKLGTGKKDFKTAKEIVLKMKEEIV